MKGIRMCAWLAALLMCGTVAAQTPQIEERKQDHDALRAVLEQSAQALTSRNMDLLAPIADSGLIVITVDNQKLIGLDAFRKYYNGLFDGASATLTKFETKPVADDLTRFLSETTGVAYGTTEDTFHFKDGDVRSMKSRWSAVVQKEANAWKLVSVHFSANLVDNPVIHAAKSYAMKLAAGAAVAGLIVGALLMMLMRRKPA